MRCTSKQAAALGSLLGLFASCQFAAAQPCQPGWRTEFPANNIDSDVRAWAVYNDGTGPTIYAGGNIVMNGAVQSVNIVKWVEGGWTPVGSAGVTGTVFAIAVFDDGSGPALYAGGQFLSASGIETLNIARWNGKAWSPVGSGFDSRVLALAVHDDGSGPALYAGGDFVQAGATTVNHIARWSGAGWSGVGLGVGASVRALATHDNGTGSSLYAGGDFTSAGGAPADHLARWNGSSWTGVGGGLTPGAGSLTTVRALRTFNGGGGASLIVGGAFSIPQPFGQPSMNGVAAWGPGGWSRVGDLGQPDIHTIATMDDGSGPRLYVGGKFFANNPPFAHIASWNGLSWSNMNGGAGSPSEFVFALSTADVDGTPRLLVGGNFSSAGPFASAGVTTWTGTGWSPLGNGPDKPVDALLAATEGGNPVIYAAGRFRSVGPVPANRIARWDGAEWSPLGSGIEGLLSPEPTVAAMALFDDGTGPALYAAGRFTTAGGAPASNIAKWNGAAWSSLGLGINGLVLALTVHDDGNGPALYAGGTFTTAGTTAANNIAKWNGGTWSRLSTQGMDGTVWRLLSFDNGSGPVLYAGGSFTHAGGQAASRVARWNGTSWNSVGDGLNNTVSALALYDSGSGPELYAGGTFSASGSTPMSCLGRWNGSAWSSVGTGVGGQVSSLQAFDDGSGVALFAGGAFATAGTVTAPGIVRWNGSEYSPLAGGTGGTVSSFAVSPPALRTLYVGGPFTSANNRQNAYLSAWRGCPCYANCDESTTLPLLNVNDFICFLNRFAAGDPYTNCDLSTTPPVLNVNDLVCFQIKYAIGCP